MSRSSRESLEGPVGVGVVFDFDLGVGGDCGRGGLGREPGEGSGGGMRMVAAGCRAEDVPFCLGGGFAGLDRGDRRGGEEFVVSLGEGYPVVVLGLLANIS